MKSILGRARNDPSKEEINFLSGQIASQLSSFANKIFLKNKRLQSKMYGTEYAF
jgi:hypothetical protein